MPDYNGVDTSNVFAALEDDVEKEKEKDGKDEKKKDATVPRKKTDKKDKEKHGKQSSKAAPPAETTRQKKHEGFDRRPGPGPLRKQDKRSGGGKWDKEQQVFDDAQLAQDQEQGPSGAAADVPNQESDVAAAPDAKDAKVDDKPMYDLDEWKAQIEKKRPEGDELKPRAPRVDGDFREVKEFVKEKTENMKIDLPKAEQKEKKSFSTPATKTEE